MEPAPTVFERIKLLQLQIVAVTKSLDNLLPLDDLEIQACRTQGALLAAASDALDKRLQAWGAKRG